MKKIIMTIFVFSLSSLFYPVFSADPPQPAALLIQAKGPVSISREGRKWKPVTRNRFLFDGDQVKTGAEGNCKLVFSHNQTMRKVESESHMRLQEGNAIPLSGKISDPMPISGIPGTLMRKYAVSQKYTVVMRSAAFSESNRLETADDVSVSPGFRDFVWENVGSQYAYRLVIDDTAYRISSISGDVVRIRLPELLPGPHNYRVEVLQGDSVVFSPAVTRKITWLTESEERAVLRDIESLSVMGELRGFFAGHRLDEAGLKVAAMDRLEDYFYEHPKEIELSPILIKVYADLKLNRRKRRESIQFNRAIR